MIKLCYVKFTSDRDWSALKKLIAALLTVIFCIPPVMAGALHRDVQRHWSADAVNTLVENGVLNGYTDGTFRPEDYMTREQAAVLYYRFLKIKYPETEYDDAEFLELTDVEEGRWSEEAIKYTVANGMLSVTEQLEFFPMVHITREDACIMMHSYSVENFFEGEVGKSFTDTTSEEIIDLANRGIVSGYGDGSFKPQAPIKRGEFAMIMSRICGFEILPAEITLPEQNVIPTPYISQLYPVYAVVGCEPTSLLMGLKAKGYALDVDLRTFLDNMPKTSSNPAKGFVGSPYSADPTKKTRTTIYPPILAEYASQYGNVRDFSGRSVEDIQAEVLDGNPIVAYCTMWWEAPYYRNYNIEGEIQRLLSNNHVILVCGYNGITDQYYIADPYNKYNTREEYYYWIDASVFEPIYNERKHALVVR